MNTLYDAGHGPPAAGGDEPADEPAPAQRRPPAIITAVQAERIIVLLEEMSAQLARLAPAAA